MSQTRQESSKNSFPLSLNQTNHRTCSVAFLWIKRTQLSISSRVKRTVLHSKCYDHFIYTISRLFVKNRSRDQCDRTKTCCLSGYVLLHYETQELHENWKNEKKFFPKERPKNHNFIPLQSSEPYINARGRMRKRERKSEFMYCKVLSLLLPHPPATRSSEPPSGSPPTFSLRLPFLIGHPSFK